MPRFSAFGGRAPCCTELNKVPSTIRLGNMATTPDPSRNITHLSNQVRAAEVKLAEARDARDQEIRNQIIQNGRTMYAMGKLAGITPSGIRKIMDK